MALALFSCARPSSVEEFVRTDDVPDGGRYDFKADFSDTSVRYGLDFFLSFQSSNNNFRSFQRLPLTVGWRSPSDRIYEETFWVGRAEMSDSGFFHKRFISPYREGVSVREPGEWTLSVDVPKDSVGKYGLEGIGLIVRREDGTR